MAEPDPISLRIFDVNRPSGLVDDDDGAAAQLFDDLRSLLAPDPQREDTVPDAIRAVRLGRAAIAQLKREKRAPGQGEPDAAVAPIRESVPRQFWQAEHLAVKRADAFEI
jgi:hypothetical protein